MFAASKDQLEHLAAGNLSDNQVYLSMHVLYHCETECGEDWGTAKWAKS
jgi:hypothetical protein